jgi:hypothetical protein
MTLGSLFDGIAARSHATGNSIAIPCAAFILEQIAKNYKEELTRGIP